MSDNLETPGPTYRIARRSGMDQGTKRLAIIAGGLGGALLLIVGVWTASGHHGGAVPVIEADARPMRVKPENPGGLQVAGANDEILSGDAGPQADKLLPPPEVPAPQALKDQKPVPQTTKEQKPAVASAALPPVQPVSLSPERPVPAPTAAVVPDRKPTAAAPEHKQAAATPAGKSTQVQLAAFTNEQAALTEWQRLSKRMPDILNGRQPAVLKAERDGHAIWRLRTGGFTDTAQATAFCERVRAKGAGCSIASF
ncbi:MAG TPA: SPOR domain-containing protein [Acetobacteraceae bacterium]|nr:SPOR domain-containing protein [Acetobacteraceae bacterium]